MKHNFRHNRLHHARQMTLKENLLDVVQLQFCSSDPHVQKELRKYLLPKRPKEPLPEKVLKMLATPRVLDEPVYDSDDSEDEGDVESETEAKSDDESEEESEAESDEESEEESEAESETESESEMEVD